MTPEDVGAVYARHEATVLRFFMERVRSPELACDLTAETFAAALADAHAFDPTREPEATWVLGLANAQLLRAYRVGEVDAGARERLGLAPVALDDRTLDHVWQLRGPDRSDERKPRSSGHVLVGEDARGVAEDDTLGGAGDVVLPSIADGLAGAARQRHSGRRRRRRLVIAVRVVVALVTVTWVVGEAVIPDRPRATTGAVWLPYETEHARGEFPRTWYMAQLPPDGREAATFTTFATGDGARRRCSTMGARDALVSILDGRPRPPAAGCARGARVSRRSIRDGLWALIVLGPRASGATRREADEIVERVRRPA
jgi:sigma-70-like protein